MKFRTAMKFSLPLLFAVTLFATEQAAKTTTVKGYVIDSACAFTKGLQKPISADCATALLKPDRPW